MSESLGESSRVQKERLDAGIKLIDDERAASIATKLNGDMTQMRSEANTSRETLRALIEAKLEPAKS